jgi:hypothetical protein
VGRHNYSYITVSKQDHVLNGKSYTPARIPKSNPSLESSNDPIHDDAKITANLNPDGGISKDAASENVSV